MAQWVDLSRPWSTSGWGSWGWRACPRASWTNRAACLPAPCGVQSEENTCACYPSCGHIAPCCGDGFTSSYIRRRRRTYVVFVVHTSSSSSYIPAWPCASGKRSSGLLRCLRLPNRSTRQRSEKYLFMNLKAVELRLPLAYLAEILSCVQKSIQYWYCSLLTNRFTSSIGISRANSIKSTYVRKVKGSLLSRFGFKKLVS